MKRVWRWMIPVLVAAVVGWSGSPAFAQGAKTARGTVTAMAGDSVTVKVRDQDMKFTVDDKTEAIAVGGSRQTAAAQKAGAAGPKLSDVIKVGQAVEVSYHDMNGVMHAASIRAVATAGAGGGSMTSAAPAAKRASGAVKAVSADSLTVSSGGKDMMFAVDASTNVVAPGAGTKSAAAGGKLVITEAVKMGDRVTVSYHDMNGKMHAAEVRVTAKGTTK